MTLDEQTKDFKKQLEESISKLVSDYEHTTGLLVEDIRCERDYIGMNYSPISFSYKIIKT